MSVHIMQSSFMLRFPYKHFKEGLKPCKWISDNENLHAVETIFAAGQRVTLCFPCGEPHINIEVSMTGGIAYECDSGLSMSYVFASRRFIDDEAAFGIS